MALTLSLLRHAKSDWDDPTADDFERPLAPRGLKAAPLMGRTMAGMGLVPDLVLCSPATRTRDTLALVLAEMTGPRPDVRYVDELYLAPPETILNCVRKVKAGPRHILVVAHNPGLHALARSLAAGGNLKSIAELAEKYPTAALAVFTFDVASWRHAGIGNGRLTTFLTPRGVAGAAASASPTRRL